MDRRNFLRLTGALTIGLAVDRVWAPSSQGIRQGGIPPCRS